MLTINFYSDSDLADYSLGIKEYQQIWRDDGERIVKAWEGSTGLAFRESTINAVIFEGRSCSHPLSLRHDLELDRKKAVLVHELGHRILYKLVKGMGASSLERHKFLFLVLYDVLVDVYGEEFAKVTVEFDKDISLKLDRPLYIEAWDYALAFNKEQRKAEFLKTLNS